MTENSGKASMKSFGSHINPEKDEELKSTKIEIDNKVAKITKLIKNKNKGKKDGISRKDSEVVEFIQDFHKQYQSLYVLYDNLIGEARGKVSSREEKEGCSAHSSDSESYYSPDETGSRTSDSRGERRRVKDGFKQKLETSNAEVAELRNKLTSMSMEKEGLGLEYMASLNKIQESEKIIEGLTIEAEHTKSIKEKLIAESRKLKEKLAEREKTHQVQESKASAQIKKLENQVTSLKLELQTLRIQKRGLEEQTERRATEAKREGEENLGLKARIFEHEHKTLEERESLKIRVKDLELKLDTLLCQKNQLEEQIIVKDNEADHLREEKERSSVKILEMEKSLIKRSNELSAIRTKLEGLENDDLREEKERSSVKILEMEKSLIERSNELSAIQTKLEGLENDASNHGKSLGEQVNNLQQELDSLLTEKSQLELQIEKERKESSESLTQMQKQNIELTSKIADQQRTLKGQEDLINKLNEEHKQIKGKKGTRLSFQIAEKRIEEMAEEFRKKFEDNLRILSRRIRVAEQLHVENKECYVKMKERCEQEHVDLKEKVITDEVAQLDVKEAEILGLREKVWKLENEIRELDVKEAEILGLREKIWKLENEIRELEEMVKEKEEGVMVVGEEKREAIRQLCLLIDYHRNRSDYVKKLLKMSVRSKRTP